MAQRISVVTGANRGLGLATARALARDGDRIVVTARDQNKAKATADHFTAEGLDAIFAELDVTDDDSVGRFFRWLADGLGQLDVLVNNAGSVFKAGRSDTFAVPPGLMLDAMNTNTLGAFRMMQHTVPRMNDCGYGRIVNVSSGMGQLSDMDGRTPAYRASKAALNALTRVFHAEARGNVKVSSVCPGWVRTDLGGPRATRSMDEGAAGIVWAATLDDDGPSGGFFRDGTRIAW